MSHLKLIYIVLPGVDDAAWLAFILCTVILVSCQYGMPSSNLCGILFIIPTNSLRVQAVWDGGCSIAGLLYMQHVHILFPRSLIMKFSFMCCCVSFMCCCFEYIYSIPILLGPVWYNIFSQLLNVIKCCGICCIVVHFTE